MATGSTVARAVARPLLPPRITRAPKLRKTDEGDRQASPLVVEEETIPPPTLPDPFLDIDISDIPVGLLENPFEGEAKTPPNMPNDEDHCSETEAEEPKEKQSKQVDEGTLQLILQGIAGIQKGKKVRRRRNFRSSNTTWASRSSRRWVRR